MTTRCLITEAVIRAAATAGRLELTADAIVTPAARDLARKLGVALLTPGDNPEEPGRRTEPQDHVTVVAIGADHGGYPLKEALKSFIEELGTAIVDVGCNSTDSVDYPVFAARVADAVATGEAEFGVMVDGAGIGSAMVANKVPGVRAALCYDVTTAENAREHNNANLLTLGGSLVGERLAKEIVRTFLATPFGGGRHGRRVAMIDALDAEREQT
jgi:ribose 5-phosphate isomerase B